jgi:hypothetical protein
MAIYSIPDIEQTKIVDTKGKAQGVDVLSGDLQVSNAVITDTLTAIMVELKLISELLNIGLNIQDDLGLLRKDIIDELEIED